MSKDCSVCQAQKLEDSRFLQLRDFWTRPFLVKPQEHLAIAKSLVL